MDKIRCIIVDDEPLAVEILEEYVQKVDSLELKATFDSGIEALNFIKKQEVDLVFLDIQMPDLTGLQMAELVRGEVNVIFTTAYDQYALEGFELEAKDYLLKPISFDRFYKSVGRITKSKNTAASSEIQDYIFVKADYKIKKIRFDDILYIEGMKDYLRIVTQNEKVMTLQSFSKLVPNLPKEKFMRIHKSYVIALDAIDSLEKGKVKIGELFIPVGDSYKANLDRLIKERMP